jgi:hypothetical protein
MKTTIDMAREAGGDDWGLFRDFMPEIERLVALVRADEREAMLHLALLHAAPWHFQEAIRSRGQP